MLACAKLTGLIPNGSNLKAKMMNGADYDLADLTDTCKSTRPQVHMKCAIRDRTNVQRSMSYQYFLLRHCEGVMAIVAKGITKEYLLRVLLRGVRSHHKIHSGRLLQ